MPVDHSEFVIVKTLDKATPKLLSDDAFVLDGTNAGGVGSDEGPGETTAKPLPYMEFKLKEILISGVQQNGDGDNGSDDGLLLPAVQTDDLAVDPNNPNVDLTPGPDDNLGVPAVQTDDGLLLPAVKADDGLLLPAVQTDDGLLLPAVKTDDGLLLPAVQDDCLLLPAVQTGGVSVASGDVNGDNSALGDPVTFTFTVRTDSAAPGPDGTSSTLMIGEVVRTEPWTAISMAERGGETGAHDTTDGECVLNAIQHASQPEASKGDWITDVTFERFDTGSHAIYQDVVVPPPETGLAVAMETLTIAHEGFWV